MVSLWAHKYHQLYCDWSQTIQPMSAIRKCMYILGKKLNCHLNLFLKILNWQFNSTLVNLQHITSNTCSIIHARQPKSPETTLKRWCSESHGALTGLVPSQTYAASPFTCSDKQFASTSSQAWQRWPSWMDAQFRMPKRRWHSMLSRRVSSIGL